MLNRVLMVAVFLMATGSYGQEGVISLEIESAAMSEARAVLVSLPESYAEEPERRYPVLYVLNEATNFDWACAIEDVLSPRDVVPELIVVGLPHTGAYVRDNSPYAGESSTEVSRGVRNHAANIVNEVIPYVDAEYRTLNSRIIVGHSLSGLFVTYLFSERPDAFNAYVAISPSLHHGMQLIPLLQERLESGAIRRGNLYFAMGEQEHSQIQAPYAKLREMLRSAAPEGLDYELATIPNTNHRAAGYVGLFHGLSWIWRGWDVTESMAESMTLEEVVRHFDAMSERLGYAVAPREGNTLGLAGFLLSRRGDAAAALSAYRVAQHYNPETAETRRRVAFLDPWLRGGTDAVRAVDASVFDEETVLEVADNLRRGGLLDDAVGVLELARELYPESDAVRRAYRRVERSRGR